jgi:hypothetical protein
MPLRISQGWLNTLSTCPRKFQHIFLDQIGSPTTLEQRSQLDWGNRFHLFMQQYELGLSVEAGLETGAIALSSDDSIDRPTDAIVRCAQAFIDQTPSLFPPQPARLRQSEHQRTLEWSGYWFTVIYDLLILTDDHAQILDWKTYAQPQTSKWLAQNWQTRLYRFVLAETSDYTPDQISMTYWFIRPSTDEDVRPEFLRFPYSMAQHEQTRQDLTALLAQLTTWLAAYQSGDADFPQVPETSGHCRFCPFAMLCQRPTSPLAGQSIAPHLLNVEEIQEIVL